MCAVLLCAGILGLTKEVTSWPVALSELPEQGKPFLAALQTFVTPGNPKADWTSDKQRAWDVIVQQHGPNARSTPFASRIELKGAQTFCLSSSEEEGLAVDLKNGLAERLKAISMQLAAMQ